MGLKAQEGLFLLGFGRKTKAFLPMRDAGRNGFIKNQAHCRGKDIFLLKKLFFGQTKTFVLSYF